MVLNFDPPLQSGKLIERYKRFFADVETATGERLTVHCPNTGSMKTCGAPGDRVWYSDSGNPKRKLRHTWEFTETTGGLIGVNTHRANQIVRNALDRGMIPGLNKYETVQTEVPFKNSRIDFRLSSSRSELRPLWIEVKNVTLLIDGQPTFPDAVTTRGQKHLRELAEIVESGDRAMMLFVINRPEGEGFSLARQIDPAYADGAIAAQKAGVEFSRLKVKSDPCGVTVCDFNEVTL